MQSFRKPLNSPQKSDEEIIIGDINLEIKVPNISYTRSLDLGPILPAEAKSPMASKLLGDAEIRYLVHLPTPAKSTNADLISADKKTLTWQVPVAELLAGPVEMNLAAPIPRIKLYAALAGVFLLSLLIYLYYLWKLRLKKSP